MFSGPMWAGGGWRREPEAPSLVFGDVMDAEQEPEEVGLLLCRHVVGGKEVGGLGGCLVLGEGGGPLMEFYLGQMLDLPMASTKEASIADGLEPLLDLFLVFVMGSLMTNDGNPEGVSDGTRDGRLDRVTLGMLDGTSMGPDVGPSDGLNDGSVDGRRLGTSDGPSLGLPDGLSDGGNDGNSDGVWAL